MPPSDTGARGFHFVVPGDIQQLTGGYVYDRRMVSELRALGLHVLVHELKGAFPCLNETSRQEGARFVAEIEAGATVVVDGLALPAFYSQISALARRTKLIALVHHPLFLERELPASERKRLREAEAHALSRCGGVLVTSQATRSDVVALGINPERVAVVEPGTEALPAKRSRALAGTDGPLNILCVGTVIERKGHSLLVSALSRCRDLSWRLDCVGSLEREPETVAALEAQLARARLQDRIMLHGEVSSAELARLYSEADLFVLASRHEGYGMALAEAMGYGIPVVSTTAGAIPQTVPAEAGILVPPGDVDALAQALRNILQDEAMREAIGSAGLAVRRRGWSDAARQFLRELQKIEERYA